MKTKMFGVFFIAIILGFGGMAQADLNDGLVSYYPFNGNANDASGNGYDGTVIGATLTNDRSGNLSSAYHFDGTNDYIEIATGELVAQDDISISAWINLDTLSKSQATIFTQNDISGGRVTHQFRVGGGNTASLEYDNWSPGDGWLSSNETLEADNWYYVTVTRNNNSVKLYIDGRLVESGAGEARESASTIDNTLIGARYYRGSVQSNVSFQGTIDEVRIYNRALSESEIQELYTATDSGSPDQTPITPPASPTLSVSTSVTTLNLSWAAVSGATGYTLHYAPYPYAGANTIGTADMGTNTSFSATLWDGASYYVTITSSNSDGTSEYSNVELFTISEIPIGSKNIVDTDYSWIVPYDDTNNSTFAENLWAVGNFATNAASSIALSYLDHAVLSAVTTYASFIIDEIKLVGGMHSTRVIVLNNNGVVDKNRLNAGEEYTIICVNQPSSGMELPQNLYIDNNAILIAPYMSSPFMGELIIPKRTFSFDSAGEYEISCGEASFWRNQIETTSVTVQNSPTFSYGGNYSGTFSGDDYGTWSVIVSSSGGIDGSAYSHIVGTIQVTGSVDNDGTAVFGGATNSGTSVTYEGLFTQGGDISGNWITGLGNQGLFVGSSSQ